MNTKDIKQFKNHLLAIGLRPSTTRKYIYYTKQLSEPVNKESIDELIVNHNNNVCRASIKQFLRYKGKLKLSTYVKFKQRKAKPKKIGLSNDEFNKLIKKLGYRDQLICIILRLSGFRVSEVLGDKDDLEKGLKPENIKGNKLTLKLKGGRWDYSELPEWLIKLINDYVTSTRTAKGERLFKISANWFWRILNKASAEAGIRHVHPHLLKHTTARDCYDAQLDVNETRIMLHHLKVDTTIDHYAFEDRPDLWKTKNKLFKEPLI